MQFQFRQIRQSLKSKLAAIQEPNTSIEPSAPYIAQLDGLRAVAFLLVFLHHSGPISSPEAVNAVAIYPAVNKLVDCGWVGVDIFFVISGFLITKLLRDEVRKFGNIDVLAFICRRALRIWPIYYTVIVTGCIVLPLILITRLKTKLFLSLLLTQFLPLAIFFGNYSLCWNNEIINDVATSTRIPITYLLGPLWSLAIEEQFYLLWPLLLQQVKKLKAICTWAAVLILLSIIARLALWNFSRHTFGLVCPHRIYYYATVSHLEPIMAGCLIGALYKQFKLQSFVIKAKALLWPLLLCCIIAFAFLPSLADNKAINILTMSLSACTGTITFLLALNSKSVIDILSNPMLRAFGRLTYSMYIFHFFVIALVAQLGPATGHTVPWAGRLLCSLSVTYLLAKLSWIMVESRFNSYRSRFLRHPG